MLSAMTSCALVGAGIHPLLAFVICLPAAFVVGYILHITIYRWLRNFSKNDATFESNAMLMSFGLYFYYGQHRFEVMGYLVQELSIFQLSRQDFRSDHRR